MDEVDKNRVSGKSHLLSTLRHKRQAWTFIETFLLAGVKVGQHRDLIST